MTTPLARPWARKQWKIPLLFTHFLSRLAHRRPLLIAICVGSFTAFFRLGARGLWGDEIWEASWPQQQPLAQTFQRFQAPPDLPLHFMLVQLSTDIGSSEFWVRLPSALLGAGTVLFVFLLARDTFGTATGLVCSVLLAMAPYHVWYAQEARPYIGLTCYSVATLYFFCLILRRRSWAAGVGFAVATTLNIYNHLFGLFPLLIEVVALAVWAVAEVILVWREPVQERPRKRSRKLSRPPQSRLAHVWTRLRFPLAAVGGGALAAILLSAPLWNGIATYLTNKGPGEVLPAPFEITPDFLVSLFGLFGAGQNESFWLLAVLFVLGTAVALYRRQWFAFLALGWLGLPLVIMWLVQPRHIFIPRYVLFMQPVYWVMIAYGLVGTAQLAREVLLTRLDIHGRLASVLTVPALVSPFLIAAVGITAAPTWRGYWVDKVTDWSAVCTYLHGHAQPSDIITGDEYVQGIMSWCLRPGDSESFVPVFGTDSLTSLARGGRNVWYVMLDGVSPGTPEAYVKRHFVSVPLSAWARPGMRLLLSDRDRVMYPVSEHLAALYHDTSTHVPHRLVFHDPQGRLAYTPVSAGGDYYARLSLPATRRRVLHLVYANLVGRNLDVVVDRRLVARLRPTGTTFDFKPIDIPLPMSVRNIVLVDVRDPGSQPSAFSEVDLRYAHP
jgi:Dolichyl-phosphate-mannose-protein mannosyltransferase